MTNHVHLIALPAREDSLSIMLRRVHGRYAQYYNARSGRSGHLWQNRFFACTLGPCHLWAALAYVERNPVRAGMVGSAGEYRWSSARTHLTGKDEYGILDLEWWQREGRANWGVCLEIEDQQPVATLRACTYAGRPFGDENFVKAMGERFGRQWVRGRPAKTPAAEGKKRTNGSAENAKSQFALFATIEE
jgi:putative transposase